MEILSVYICLDLISTTWDINKLIIDLEGDWQITLIPEVGIMLGK